MHPHRSRISQHLTLTDIFCGCGGSSTGAVHSGLDVKMALNHWELAVESHNTNHPDTWHDCVDVSAARPDYYPRTDVLWASPECTNHSLAKGTKYQRTRQEDFFENPDEHPEAKRSRATMWDVVRFAEWHDYEVVVVENVPDARRWQLFEPWWQAMRKLGYEGQCLYLNSMFFPPTPQSRDRLYVVWWKEGNDQPDLDIRPPAYCPRCEETRRAVQSWRDTKLGRARIGLRYGVQYEYRCPECAEAVTPYYYAAFNAIDWSIGAPKIGERDRSLAEKTMERIRYGLKEYGRKPLVITTRYTSGTSFRVRDATAEELPTQPGDYTHGLLSPYFVQTAYSHAPSNRAYGPDEPMRTQTGQRSMAMVCPHFLSKQYSGYKRPVSMEEPMGAQTTSYSHALVGLPMLTSVNDFDDRNIDALREATGTQTTQTKWAVVRPPAFIAELHGTSDARGIDEPLMGVTAGGNHHALIDTRAFLSYYYSSAEQASGLDEPAGTMTARDRAALSEVPDEIKPPPEDAPEEEVERWVDAVLPRCSFRMLQPEEIQAAMAFPGDYEVLGTKREQVKQLGNAVTPPVAREILHRCADSLS